MQHLIILAFLLMQSQSPMKTKSVQNLLKENENTRVLLVQLVGLPKAHTRTLHHHILFSQPIVTNPHEATWMWRYMSYIISTWLSTMASLSPQPKLIPCTPSWVSHTLWTQKHAQTLCHQRMTNTIVASLPTVTLDLKWGMLSMQGCNYLCSNSGVWAELLYLIRWTHNLENGPSRTNRSQFLWSRNSCNQHEVKT